MNNAYINIVEHTSGNKPISVRDYSNIDFSSAIDLLIKNTNRTLVSLKKMLQNLKFPYSLQSQGRRCRKAN